MYKCLECGHIFDEGEQATWRERHGLIDGLYEHFTGCPICKCAYEETVRCHKCGGEFLSDELFTGNICEECLMRSVSIDMTVQYVLNNGLDESFYVSHWTVSSVNHASAMLVDIAKKAFHQQVETSPEIALYSCEEFVKEGLESYAEWLKWKESNHETEEVP